MPQERQRHDRCRTHGAQRLQVLRPLGNGFEVLGGDVFDEEGLFRVDHGTEEIRAICDRSAFAPELRKAPLSTDPALTTFSRLSCSCSSMISTMHQSAKSRTTRCATVASVCS